MMPSTFSGTCLDYLSFKPEQAALELCSPGYSPDAEDFVSFVEENGYDGLGFLRELPQFKVNFKLCSLFLFFWTRLR
ncbi:MAG: hypothetical protein NZ873_01015 [Crenarchaeota archaeon]|nr:hypothetical protein [Thermoproteota archaeon]MDW8033740.1 hypothetical protein [Nitrososphaerota archaeon]